jgi:hypothetical protein
MLGHVQMHDWHCSSLQHAVPAAAMIWLLCMYSLLSGCYHHDHHHVVSVGCVPSVFTETIPPKKQVHLQGGNRLLLLCASSASHDGMTPYL